MLELLHGLGPLEKLPLRLLEPLLEELNLRRQLLPRLVPGLVRTLALPLLGGADLRAELVDQPLLTLASGSTSLPAPPQRRSSPRLFSEADAPLQARPSRFRGDGSWPAAP